MGLKTRNVIVTSCAFSVVFGHLEISSNVSFEYTSLKPEDDRSIEL